jgi:hypothetical protein
MSPVQSIAKVVMALHFAPRKKYRLADGSIGNEFQAVTEAIKRSEAQKQVIEDRIERLRIQLETAEGRPV